MYVINGLGISSLFELENIQANELVTWLTERPPDYMMDIGVIRQGFLTCTWQDGCGRPRERGGTEETVGTRVA